MVHSGGFYSVQKMQLNAEEVPPILHWFKWEAAWTWITGIFLLLLIFYTGQGIYLLDDSVSDISFPMAALLGISSIVVSWLVYDFLWMKMGSKPLLANLISIVGLIAIAFIIIGTDTRPGQAHQ